MFWVLKGEMGTMKGLYLAFVGLVVLHGGSLLSTHAAVHYYDFVLEETNFTKLCSTKSILTVNGSFPGPEIRVHAGDTAFVTIHNNGTYGVTIHWHGVRQPRNPWSDGPENVTQCPIPPGTSFTQEIIFTAEEGTLWWHAHSDWTRATVHGPIIILPKTGTTYPFAEPDAEQTIVLGEWYKGDVMAIIDEALASGGDPNVSDAFTVNGQPGDLYGCSNATTFRMMVDYGKTYLLRVINAIMNEEMFFGIANHTLKVVGMDAAYLKPIEVPYVMITPGQTMDILVTANQPRSHYYMEASPFADTSAPFDNTSTTAVFQYQGGYTPPSKPYFPSLPAYNNKTAVGNFTKLLRSLASKAHPVSVPLNITHRIFMTVSVNQIACANASCAGPNGNRLSASLNNISFVTPTIDILEAYYSGIPNVFNKTFPDVPPYLFNFTGDVGSNTLFPSRGTEVKVIEYGAAVEIIWQGTNIGAAENHPMHLHGYSFYVVGMGDGNFDNKTSPSTYNLVDPPEVNTIGLPKNGWTTMRFVADNPGVWFMHCHLERHASWGMDTVIISSECYLEGDKASNANIRNAATQELELALLDIREQMGGRARVFILAPALLVFLFLLQSAQAVVHHYTFVLEEKKFTKLCSTKSILTVNGSFPGPEIRVRKGDTAFVTVHNRGTYGVTIHWHGVKQPRNPWSDGPENITQCPIPANTSFTQEIIFSDEEGTLWWHAHSDWTRATVHGPIIILPEKGKSYPFTKPYAEQTIVLGEWYKGDVMAIIDEAIATGGDPNVSDAYTINGQPGDLYDCSNTTTFNMLVVKGKTYLLRIISAIMNEEMFFGIANHTLTVVGMDGAYLKPFTVDYIMITPGQTINVLITANQASSYYYIQGTPFADTSAPYDTNNVTAIFRYRKATRPDSIGFPTLPGATNKTAVTEFTDQLRSLASTEHPVDVPKNITKRVFITVSVNQIYCANESCGGPDGNRLAASLSNISFVTPTIDILQAYYSNISGIYNGTFPHRPSHFNFTGIDSDYGIYPSQGTEAIMIDYGAAVEFIFQGTNIGNAENHPMHLHGFSFYVVGSGDGNFDKSTSLSTYNLDDPPLVNTIGVPKNGWTTIRFVADNPGVWFMHCHLERHASWGMNTVVIVKDGTTPTTSMIPPPPYMPPCS
ncbi:hypothetical protein SAY86_004821 [Trapa natans]|uniref:Laccase n=1 Tax=Trapa natans TaxID=22666 RepID=A0AAN7MGR2_TRANT|nr:hypothetical protein SAY86_004821 [Trapa natans]